MSRTGKSIINSIVGLICCIISSILSFFLNAILIRLLGLEYAGINNLFNSILSIINIVDLGVSNAILYRLYKSISTEDNVETSMYLSIYRKICFGIGVFIAILGFCCIPFLKYLIKYEPNFPEPLSILFIIVLATSIASHIFDYLQILIIAKQERFIQSIISYSTLFLCHGLQIAVLYFYKNIYLYLGVKLVTTILNFSISVIISHFRYHITSYSKKKLPKEIRSSMLKDIGSLAVFKVCRTLDANIDAFLIAKFIDLSITAVYGSFLMIFNAMHELLGIFNDSMLASIGDLYTKKDYNHFEEVFYQSFHLTFLLYGISVTVLAPFISDFAIIWIGHTLPDLSIYVILLNFVMYGFGMNIAVFRNSMGIFKKGWLRPAFTALLNLIFSFLLVQKFGLIGTLIGTTIARILTLSWYDPYLVLWHGMRHTPWKYYKRYIIYLLIIICLSKWLLILRKYLPQMVSIKMAFIYGFIYMFCAGFSILAIGCLFTEQKALIQRGIITLKRINKNLLNMIQ